MRDRPGGGAVVELRLPRQNGGHVPAVPEMAPAVMVVAKRSK